MVDQIRSGMLTSPTLLPYSHFVQRPKRQHNAFDCGAWVTWDIYSLVTIGRFRPKTDVEMANWRSFVVQMIRRLPPPPPTQDPQSLPIIDLTSDDD